MAINVEAWESLSLSERSRFLERNFQVNGLGKPRKPLYGVGINDVSYRTRPIIDGVCVSCPAYKAWQGILVRAYSSKYKDKNKTYSEIVVCNEWLKLSEFRRWWIEHQIDDWQIDKDLLSDSGLYSPETCIFVPAWLNTFTLSQESSRGDWPIGVYMSKNDGVFHAQCRNPISMRRENLGSFSNQDEAHNAWLTRKLEIALELKPRMDEVDARIYPRVVEMVRSAK